MDKHTTDYIELGTRIGRSQAFGAIAIKCSAAQAKSLLEVWESESYKLLNVTWEQYCHAYVGLSRQRVEGIIRNLKEFGEVYCQLRDIVGISPEAYRQIESKIQDEKIEIAGELVPIVPENAARIREAISRLRADLRKARDEVKQANQDIEVLTSPEMVSLQSRLDSCFADIRRARTRQTADSDAASLRGLVRYSLDHLQAIARELGEETAN
ncbi:MAG TPA: hypothetical protein VGH38_10865 [Bryobacteraceae bacterium]